MCSCGAGYVKVRAAFIVTGHVREAFFYESAQVDHGV